MVLEVDHGKNLLSVNKTTEAMGTEETQETNTVDQGEKGGHVTMPQLMEVILSMKEELRNKIDTFVGDLRKDVSQIKEQLNKYGDRFEETENRLSNVEDKI